MSHLEAKYHNIYLVAYKGSKSSAHRVAERKTKGVAPKTISFFGNYVTEIPDETYSTLVLNEDLWQQWFKNEKFLPGFATAKEAAETLVKTETDIFYGCPICSFHTKDFESAQKHIEEHATKFITQFEIISVED